MKTYAEISQSSRAFGMLDQRNSLDLSCVSCIHNVMDSGLCRGGFHTWLKNKAWESKIALTGSVGLVSRAYAAEALMVGARRVD